MNSFNLCLEKSSFHLQILFSQSKRFFLKKKKFCFLLSKDIFPCLLTCITSEWKSVLILVSVLPYVTCLFFYVCFKIVFLHYWLSWFDYDISWCFNFFFKLNFTEFSICGCIVSPNLENFLQTYLQISFCSVISLPSFGTPITHVISFNIIPYITDMLFVLFFSLFLHFG